MDRDHGRARGHDGITPGNPDLTRHTPEQVRNRLILMAAISIALLSVFPFIQDSSYRGSPDSHATMQMIGACFGILAGLVLMVHFYSFGERLYLFMGLAFLINGIGDFFHGLVSYQYVREWTGLTDSTLDQFIPASFATGRILFGILLLLGPISERTSSRSPDPGRETIRAVVIFLTVLAVLLTVILTVSLPGLIHPDRAITRPMDLASAMILIAALAVYVKRYVEHRELLFWWVTFSLPVHIIGQLMMSFSADLYDGFFEISHQYKILGYVIPLLGFTLYQYVIISDREKIGNELLRSTGELDQIFNNAPDGMRVIARDYSVIRANRTMVAMAGLGIEEFVGYRCHSIFSNTLCRTPDCPLPRILGGEERVEMEIEEVRRDGRTFPCILTAIPYRDPHGRVIGIIEDVRDITERKLSERKLKRTMAELVRSNNDLEQFAYIASHDLQEPLRMVSSYVQLLDMRYRGRLDKDADDFISFAVDGAGRMQVLINDLLQFARVTTQGKELKRVDLNEVMDRVLTDMQTSINETGASITSEDLPVVNADDTQMGQVFRNLIGNAIKFRTDRPPVIGITAEKQRKNWIISISDNGIGIDREYYDRIFVIFQRLHGIGTYEGTGIGLALTKKIIERHGGRIWVESVKGEGSTFYITLPSIETGEGGD